ncbi:MAG: 30S ribosomal protein S24e [Methanoregulaceae archaeon PtaB.Bin108]|nr:MAG: 30S ribosomal protein S24e [Methanoregulaceae archaeon PtaB.Bin108]OPY43341.1 MAG: 30S ribosomal protein S24e [Methanoregulaceae archaeon PtaU1.Bin222]
MEFEVTRDTRNELLGRREVDFSLSFDGATPSRMQVVGKLAAVLNVPEKQVVLDSLKTSFGLTACTGSARVYDTEERRNQIERSFLLKRGVPKPKEEGA